MAFAKTAFSFFLGIAGLAILSAFAFNGYKHILAGSIKTCSSSPMTAGACSTIDSFCNTIGGAPGCYKNRTQVPLAR
ncbi:MAG: hypothetical protein KDK41_09625 [Leptospiraceae bacterium]|nr:hypothetical protein [Leptospiraceae bacterium]MCB1200891.1 hypothetical protein [Leptospiraceae bacterium]